jgi:hypothetical protein
MVNVALVVVKVKVMTTTKLTEPFVDDNSRDRLVRSSRELYPPRPARLNDRRVSRHGRGKSFPRTPRNWQVAAGNVKLWCLTGASG